VATKVIIGQHRSAALAERHRADLQREFPRAIVRITSRFGSDGQASDHGHFFRFSVTTKPKRKKRIAYLVSFSYQPVQKGSKKLIQADLIVGGKPGMPKDAVIKMVEDIAFKEGFTKGKFTWLHDILAATEDENIRVDPAPKERAPKKIKIRSVKRGGSEIFEDEDDDEE
jgi:hypothetical protein